MGQVNCSHEPRNRFFRSPLRLCGHQTSSLLLFAAEVVALLLALFADDGYGLITRLMLLFGDDL